MDWTITDAATDTRYTTEQAEAWLRSVVAKPTLRFCDDVAELDDGLNLNPSLQHVGLLNNRDELMQSPVWPTLSDSLCAWLVWVDEDEIPAITDAVISAAVAHYREEIQ